MGSRNDARPRRAGSVLWRSFRRQPVTFKFQEGDIVSLRENYTETLPAGSHGSVFSLYTTTPPAYEINFVDIKGGEVGVVIYEDELECCLDSSCHYAGEMN